MANPLDPFGEIFLGNLHIDEVSQNFVEIFYTPSEATLLMSGLTPDTDTAPRVKLLEIDGGNRRLTIFPINMVARHENFLRPRYTQVKRITLICNRLVYIPIENGESSDSKEFFSSPYFGKTEPMEQKLVDTDSLKTVPSTPEEVMEVLEGLPAVFTSNPDQGLGLKKRYRFLIDTVEKLSDCVEIVISDDCETSIDEENSIFYISTEDFDAVRKSVNSINRLSRIATNSVVEAKTYNLFAKKIGQSTIPIEIGLHPIRKQITGAIRGEMVLSENDHENVLDLFSQNVASIAETKPTKLAKLRADIDLVNLQTLITRYEAMIHKKLHERRWQNFFNENLFILHLAFGYPIIKVQDNASVGGQKISGSGEKITDFMVKNSMTNNAAIVEIKTPNKRLLKANTYRNGVYPPSTDLAGAISQVLDQKYHFEKNFLQIIGNSRIYDLESYSVRCCLIIGTTPSEENQQRSFELFRTNSSNVEIVTFDELLKKLKDLLSFLLSEKTEIDKDTQANTQSRNFTDELPF